jgi:hypothetical protein
MNRREFVKQGGLAAGFGLAGRGAGRGVSIIVEGSDPIASAGPVKWAAGELRQALSAKGVAVRAARTAGEARAGDVLVVVAGGHQTTARKILSDAGTALPDAAEALSIAAGSLSGNPAVLAAGSDVRGALYAVLELADRVRHAEGDPLRALDQAHPLVERAANEVRSIARCFESEVEDKSWFHDQEMWRAYLDMLATQRFNRFSLTFGLCYNFPRNVRDVYLYFAYPYLVQVPGYEVRVSNLPDAEREGNLETLRFIGEQTVARGMNFQLGLWTHAYQWIDSPNANATIKGLSAANHAAYCRDALETLLRAVPSISGLTFRIHGESGVPEGNYAFWENLFQAIVRCGRKVEIDMHAKGIDQKMIEMAQATGMPVKVSPKYWAEHMGLAYHQSSIREMEMPHDRKVDSTFALSAGTRSFLRYGWGDLLTEGRSYGVLHRIWPGTQRVLLWGDPALAAGYSRYSSFCGTQGVELCEPLSFKGRMGSGLPGGRCAYVDASLNPKYDWEKYAYTYRVWGRSIYNPDTDPDGWRRYLRRSLGRASAAAEAALANASRILPLMTTAHGPSGSNNTYWPEVYTNMPIVDASRPHPYWDTPAPRRFGTVSSFDPQLFSRVEDFADELLAGDISGRYSPLEVAQWFERFSSAARRHLAEMEANAAPGAEYRRAAADVDIQASLGFFFAGKFRAAVLWALYERTGDATAKDAALRTYRAARAAWAEMAHRAKGVYRADITYGMTPHLRGHWLDRLPAIDADIADMESHVSAARADGADAEKARRAIQRALAAPSRPAVPVRHAPARGFRPGEPLPVEIVWEGGAGSSARLYYRHVNQAEYWQTAEMAAKGARHTAAIPAAYTRSRYALEYYVELRDPSGGAGLYPGFGAELSNQPYILVRQA